MSWRNKPDEYGWLAIALHWIAAIAIVGLFALGLWMTGLRYTDPWYNQAPDIHKSIGVLLIALIALRLLWRWTNPLPAFEPGMPDWERIAARGAHVLMYLLIVLVLASGYLIPTADGTWISVFGWFSTPPVVLGIERQEDLAGWVHYWSAWALIVLAAVHTLAALKHHFLDHDWTLKKMLGIRSRP